MSRSRDISDLPGQVSTDDQVTTLANPKADASFTPADSKDLVTKEYLESQLSVQLPAATDNTITGDGTQGSPLGVDATQHGHTANQIAGLAPVALTNDYNSLLNRPTSLGSVTSNNTLTGAGTVASPLAVQGANLTGIPSSGITGLATVATSGDYDDLINKPSGGGSGILEWVSVADYGANGDGTANNNTAFTNAIAALPSTGGVLYIPQGTYVLTTKLTISDKNVMIVGDGPGLSILRWDATDGGIFIDNREDTGMGADTDSSWTAAPYSNHPNVVITKLSLIANVAGAGTALDIRFSFRVGLETDLQAHISQVEIKNPGVDNTKYWTRGIYLEDCSKTVVQDSLLVGRFVTGGYTGATEGIFVYSDDAATIVHLSNVFQFYWQKAVRVDGPAVNSQPFATFQGPAEGCLLDRCVFVACGRGLSVETGAHLHFSVHQSHMACAEYCIVGGIAQSSIHGNLLYDRPASEGTFQAFIFLQGSVYPNDNIISGNHLNPANQGALAGVGSGIVVDGYRNIITNNVIIGTNTSIWLRSDSNENMVRDNITQFSGSTSVLDQGTRNILGAESLLLYRTNNSGDIGTSGYIPYNAAIDKTLTQDGATGKLTYNLSTGTITIGKGVSKIRARASVSNGFALDAAIHKNSTAANYPAEAIGSKDSGGGMSLVSGPIDVVENDTFRVNFNGGGSSFGNAGNWLEVEVLA